MLILNIALGLFTCLVMYCAFRPYTDSLWVRILLALISFSFLSGVVGAAAQQAPAAQIVTLSLWSGLGILVTFPIFHLVDQRLLVNRPS
jgi:hypothetical protein